MPRFTVCLNLSQCIVIIMSDIHCFSGPSIKRNLPKSLTARGAFSLKTILVAVVIGLMSAQFAAHTQVSVQVPSNVVGTGSNSWHYLIMEGESYVSKEADPSTGFTKVFGDEAITSFYGNPILGTNTLASKRGALFTQTTFSQWG